MSGSACRLVQVVPSGPILVEGPVQIELADGSIVESDRFMVGICTCRRSKIYPLCDASHRATAGKPSTQPKAQRGSVG